MLNKNIIKSFKYKQWENVIKGITKQIIIIASISEAYIDIIIEFNK
jgi:hypothetical protein